MRQRLQPTKLSLQWRAATLPRAMPGVPHAHAARCTRQDALQALMPQRERAQRARVLTSARSALRFATRLAVSSATRSAMRFATCNRHAHYHHPLPTALRLSTHPHPTSSIVGHPPPMCAGESQRLRRRRTETRGNDAENHLGDGREAPWVTGKGLEPSI